MSLPRYPILGTENFVKWVKKSLPQITEEELKELWIRDSWMTMNLEWTDTTFSNLKRDWELFLKIDEDHKSHEKIVECKGCGHSFCAHTSFHLRKEAGVCVFCDEYVRPYPSNPINRNHVETFVPGFVSFIYSE